MGKFIAQTPVLKRPAVSEEDAAKARLKREMTMRIDEQGYLHGANTERFDSPFFDERTECAKPELIILHNISLPCGEFLTGYPRALFLGTIDTQAHPSFASLKGLKVSSHFLVTRTGHVEQFVSTQKRAWHAGVSQFQERSGCNNFSIGIELEGSDFVAFEPAQYQALGRVIAALHERYPSIVAITGHQDVAPTRKSDPGPFFDWEYVKNQVKSLSITVYHR